MVIAAFIIALLGLVLATASLTIQLYTLLIKEKEKEKQEGPEMSLYDPETLKDVSPFEKDPTKSPASPSGATVDDHFNDVFASSDDGFTGISEDFGV